ncbi:MAG: glycosyltransferase family 9 protein [Planctomycetota bacterium]
MSSTPATTGRFSHSPWFDEVIEYQPAQHAGPSGWQAGAAAFLSTVRRLRQRNIDLALLLTHSFRSALLARLAGARYRVANSRGDQACLLTDSLPWPRENGQRVPMPKVEAYMRLCRHLGCPGADDTHLELHYSEQADNLAERLIREAGGDPEKPLFAIVPGAAFGAAKFWDTEKFAAVADDIAQRYGWQPALLCAPGEEELARQIKGYMDRPAVQPNPDEFSLDVLKPVVNRCRLMVTTDTGPRHVAEAFRVPTVVIMGPTDPRHTRTDYAARRVVRVEVPCGPCHLRTCPTDHRCMEQITPGMVIDAAEDLLQEGAS